MLDIQSCGFRNVTLLSLFHTLFFPPFVTVVNLYVTHVGFLNMSNNDFDLASYDIATDVAGKR